MNVSWVIAGGGGTFGGELVSALMGPDARATARAAAVLADLLRGNAACKQQVATLLPLDSQRTYHRPHTGPGVMSSLVIILEQPY